MVAFFSCRIAEGLGINLDLGRLSYCSVRLIDDHLTLFQDSGLDLVPSAFSDN